MYRWRGHERCFIEWSLFWEKIVNLSLSLVLQLREQEYSTGKTEIKTEIYRYFENRSRFCSTYPRPLFLRPTNIDYTIFFSIRNRNNTHNILANFERKGNAIPIEKKQSPHLEIEYFQSWKRWNSLDHSLSIYFRRRRQNTVVAATRNESRRRKINIVEVLIGKSAFPERTSDKESSSIIPETEARLHRGLR